MSKFNKYKKYINSIFFAYLFWMFILFIYGISEIYTYENKVKYGEELFNKIVVYSLALGVFTNAIGAFFAWFVNRGKAWAKWLFIIFCGWRAFDSLWGTYMLINLDPKLVETSDWVRSIIFSLVWIYFISLTRSRKKGADLI